MLRTHQNPNIFHIQAFSLYDIRWERLMHNFFNYLIINVYIFLLFAYN